MLPPGDVGPHSRWRVRPVVAGRAGSRCRLVPPGAMMVLVLAACTGGRAPARSASEGSVSTDRREIRFAGNPIIADSAHYTTDPAPFVAEGKLYVLTGRDMAAASVNDFVMPEWQLLEAHGDPMRGGWSHRPHFLRPEQVFTWALPGRAYAAQIVQGRDRRFYLYAPVAQRTPSSRDPFAIGVAVADAPGGPWVDAHPDGPIVSQSLPVANDMQNIDPTVLVDDDQRVFMYWGTFGKLKGVELARDMVSIVGTPFDVTTLNGFFEAPWLFKRNGTYYLAYAANTAGPASSCTEAVYYACIAYGTAPTPRGPWTYRGVILDPVSSTTSHPGIVQHRQQWYLTYHTADARGGGHFRRSVAIDTLRWDDTERPARIRKVVPTGGAPFDSTPTHNIASHARITASNVPVPVQYWLRALNDGKTRVAPLPPDMWATWTRTNPPSHWALYQWDSVVIIHASSLYFWGDRPAGSGIGVAPPAAWRLEYWYDNTWHPVPQATAYTSTPHADNRVEFSPVSTRCLRAVFDASTDGATYAAVAAQEWRVFAVAQQRPRRPVAQLASPACE